MSLTNSRKNKPSKPYWEMTTEELAQATREFDAEDLASGKPLGGRMLARWRLAKAKRGRPRNGEGAKRISITVEQSLLRRTDRLAKRLKTSRAQLVARGLEKVLAEKL